MDDIKTIRPDVVISDGDAPRDKVIPLGIPTRLDVPVNQVLDNAKHLEGVVIMGYDKDGEYYFASSYADGGTVMWLLEKLKQRLLG